MTTRPEPGIDRALAATAIEYVGEEHAAAEDEALDTAKSSVFSVRLSPDTYQAVRVAAARAHRTPSALIRQWVTERVEVLDGDDLAQAVATLRRDVDRVAELVRPA